MMFCTGLRKVNIENKSNDQNHCSPSFSKFKNISIKKSLQ